MGAQRQGRSVSEHVSVTQARSAQAANTEDEQLRNKHGYGLEATVAALRRVIAAQP